MKRVILGFLTVALAAAFSIAGAQDQQQGKMQTAARSFTGEIMDAACANMGSHDTMMKQEGASSAKECSDKCVQGGSKYVLCARTQKRTYQLSEQDQAKQYSG